jgi:hypothetical protein
VPVCHLGAGPVAPTQPHELGLDTSYLNPYYRGQKPTGSTKNIFILTMNAAARPRRTSRGKALLLSCRNAYGLCGRKLELAPPSKYKLTNPDTCQDASRNLKFGKAPRPHGIPSRTLQHLPQHAVNLLVRIFVAVIRSTLTKWKHTRVIPIRKPRTRHCLQRIVPCLLDTIGKLFENIPLAKILSEVRIVD